MTTIFMAYPPLRSLGFRRQRRQAACHGNLPDLAVAAGTIPRGFTKSRGHVHEDSWYRHTVLSDTLQQIALAAAESLALDEVLGRIVRGLAETADLALARIWLLAPGDTCATCSMRGQCPDQTQCLHLVASAGHPQTEPPEAWARTNGTFRRIPLGVLKVGRIAASAEPIWLADAHRDYAWIARPEWARAEGINSFAGHPLVFRGEVLGVLGVFYRTEIDEAIFGWLHAFAAQAATAIANARAFGELTLLRERVERERDYLREEVRLARTGGAIVGESAALRAMLEQIELVAPTNATVLVQGESGTGKELVAQAIHERSRRHEKPLVRVNCAAIPRELFESEFFGHVRGSFTGAVRDRAGRFELADGGTLFLDEVGEVPMELQGKLLRVLQEETFERVGEERTRRVDVRIVAATNRDLPREIEAGRFREDLFYRLAVFPIEMPPLRARRGDIGALAAHFLRLAEPRIGRSGLRLTVGDVRRLEQYEWPGNVRELASVIERATILARGDRLAIDAVMPKPGRGARGVATRTSSEHILQKTKPAVAIETESERRARERANLVAALERSGGKVYGSGGAAELLGVPSTTLASRLRALGIRHSRRSP
jgi:transcriptional regulator with GAF, ATPase, and Fis domain